MSNEAYATPGESDAMQIGRDDYRYHHEQKHNILSALGLSAACPFPQGSGDAREWQEGWNRERDGK